MPFCKGDPNINRNGRPHKTEAKMPIDQLREALDGEGEKQGKTFWAHIAEKVYTDRQVLIAVIKKFVPDITITQHAGEIFINQMGFIKKDDQPLEVDVGARATDNSGLAGQVDTDTDGDKQV